VEHRRRLDRLPAAPAAQGKTAAHSRAGSPQRRPLERARGTSSGVCVSGVLCVFCGGGGSCESRRAASTSIAWPMVCPQFSVPRSPASRSSCATTSALPRMAW
jgi:hypothetical protein